MESESGPLRGRGASFNPPNRFDRLEYVRDEDAQEQHSMPGTEILSDPSRTIIARNDSPDVGFGASINPYRGCEHGCSYCFARPTHEYLGFSAGLDFETKIVVKEHAPELLRKELMSPKWKPQVLAMSGVTDCYQPIERKLRLTRRCLAVLGEFRNPVVIVTKNHLVTRDCDLLAQLSSHQAALVCISITTLDEKLARSLEPRASMPRLRLDAISRLSAAGIRTSVIVAPVIPAITDHEIPSILAAAGAAGAQSAGYVVLRLPWTVAPLFDRWLQEHFPDRRQKVLNRVRELRGGGLYDPRWSIRQRGEGVIADQIAQLFAVSVRKNGLNERDFELSTISFHRPGDGLQQSLF